MQTQQDVWLHIFVYLTEAEHFQFRTICKCTSELPFHPLLAGALRIAVPGLVQKQIIQCDHYKPQTISSAIISLQGVSREPNWHKQSIFHALLLHTETLTHLDIYLQNMGDENELIQRLTSVISALEKIKWLKLRVNAAQALQILKHVPKEQIECIELFGEPVEIEHDLFPNLKRFVTRTPQVPSNVKYIQWLELKTQPAFIPTSVKQIDLPNDASFAAINSMISNRQHEMELLNVKSWKEAINLEKYTNLTCLQVTVRKPEVQWLKQLLKLQDLTIRSMQKDTDMTVLDQLKYLHNLKHVAITGADAQRVEDPVEFPKSLESFSADHITLCSNHIRALLVACTKLHTITATCSMSQHVTFADLFSGITRHFKKIEISFSASYSIPEQIQNQPIAITIDKLFLSFNFFSFPLQVMKDFDTRVLPYVYKLHVYCASAHSLTPIVLKNAVRATSIIVDESNVDLPKSDAIFCPALKHFQISFTRTCTIDRLPTLPFAPQLTRFSLYKPDNRSNQAISMLVMKEFLTKATQLRRFAYQDAYPQSFMPRMVSFLLSCCPKVVHFTFKNAVPLQEAQGILKSSRANGLALQHAIIYLKDGDLEDTLATLQEANNFVPCLSFEDNF